LALLVLLQELVMLQGLVLPLQELGLDL